MARKKTIETIETEISKVKSDMSRLQDRYDKLAEKMWTAVGHVEEHHIYTVSQVNSIKLTN